VEKLGFDPEVSRGVMDGESGDDGKMEPASVKWWLPAGSAAGSSAGIVFTHGPILRFFAPAGATRWGPLLPAKFHLDRLRGGV